MKNHHKTLISLSLLLLILGRLAFGTTAQSQADEGIDIVFLVDQSGSMGGEAYGQAERTPTDPLDLRFSSVQYALELLGSYRQAIGNDLSIRMAVVSFGSRAEISLNWTIIAPPTDANWDATLLGLQDQLSAENFKLNFPPGNLGVTNFIAAFERVDQLFDSLPASANQRVVIVITDGAPCVDTGENAFPCGNAAGEQSHMNSVLQFTEQEFDPSSYWLYVIALDSTENFWTRRQADWERVVRESDHAIRVENGPQIAVQLQNIITEVVASSRGATSFIPAQALSSSIIEGSTNASAYSFEVAPYQSELRLTFFKLEALPIELAITASDGRLITATSPDVQLQNPNEPIELWTISNPVPGEWTITILSQDYLIDAFWQMQPMNLQLETVPVNAELFQTVSITTRLSREDGLPLPVYPAPYNLSLVANLQQANGDILNLNFSPFGGDSYTTSFTANQVGNYTLNISLNSSNLDGSTLVLATDSLSFNVGDFVFEADTLPEGEYLEGQALTGTVSLLEETGEAFRLDNLQLRAILEDSNNVAISSQDLVENGTTGTYAYALTAPTAGTYRLRLTATSQPAGMDEQIIGNISSPIFNVLPSIQIQTNILSPLPEAEYYVSTGFPSFSEQALTIEFETLSVVENIRLDLRALGANPNLGFAIALRQGENLIAETDKVDYTSEGTYTTSFESIPTGNYELQVRVTEPLGGRYILLNEGVAQLNFTAATHPELLIFQWLLGLGLVLLILACGIAVLIWWLRRKHPLNGTISISRQSGFEDAMHLKDIRLDKSKTNRLRLSGSSLGLNKKDVIKYIEFSTEDERMSERKQMNVHVQMKSGKSYIGRLSPGESMSINAEQAYAGDGEAQPIYYLAVKLDSSYGTSGDFF